jgi:hypothetical protein
MQKLNPSRYQVFFMYLGNERVLLASFRHFTHAYIFHKDLEASDPDGNFWIEDTEE